MKFRSGYDVVKYIIKLKLSFGQTIVMMFLDFARTSALETQSSNLKLSALELIELAILMFPRGISHKWNDLKDTIR